MVSGPSWRYNPYSFLYIPGTKQERFYYLPLSLFHVCVQISWSDARICLAIGRLTQPIGILHTLLCHLRLLVRLADERAVLFTRRADVDDGLVAWVGVEFL